jgi:hypothetical protein
VLVAGGAPPTNDAAFARRFGLPPSRWRDVVG